MLSDLLVFLEFHSKWFFAILVYQNFLLFLIMFYYGKWIKSRPKLLLSEFFLISAIIFLAFLFQHTGRIKMAGRLNFLLPGGFLLLMPFVYFYIRALANLKYKTWLWALAHFIPALSILLANFIYAWKNHSVTLNLMNTPDDSPIIIVVMQTLMWGQFVFYTYQVIKYLIKNNALKFRNYATHDLRRNLWKLLFFLSFGLFSVSMSIMVLDSMMNNLQTGDIILYILGFIIITLMIGLFALKQKDRTEGVAIAVGADGTEYADYFGENDYVGSAVRKAKPQNGKSKSALTPEKREELISVFKKLVKEEVFKDPDCSLESLARKMKSNSKYVSEAVIACTGMPLPKYIVELRINEAKKLLRENNAEMYSIEGIGKIVGFRSKSTFNTHFKLLTGMTPGEYLESIKSENEEKA